MQLLRNNTESSCVSFTQFPPMVTSCSVITGTDSDVIKVQNISVLISIPDNASSWPVTLPSLSHHLPDP